MTTPEDIRAIKARFAEMTETQGAGHKLISAARDLRNLYRSLAGGEKRALLEWVSSFSDLDGFVSGADTAYFIPIAVRRKGLRRANFEHLERYTSETVGTITSDDEEEYVFNIWKSEWPYIEGFLKQFEIDYRRIVHQEAH